MLIAYHTRHEINGWRKICTYPINDPRWSEQDKIFINELIKTGEMVLTCGWNMWTIVKDENQ